MTTVFIISAPSGSGKSTLVNEVRQIVSGLDFSVSYTTRKPRGSEQDRREYCFVPRAEFLKMIERGEFLEYADVFGIGDYYGTPKGALEEAKRNRRDLLLDIDVKGAAQIMQKMPDAVTIFLLPPDRATLEKRLRSRSQDAEDRIQHRLLMATREIENYTKYDYILINDHLEDSVASLKAILLVERMKHAGSQQSTVDADTIARAERCRLENVGDRLPPILASFAAAAAQGGR
jgi:guanylate kinase